MDDPYHPLVVLAFVRGETDWRSIDALEGISIEITESSCRIEEAADVLVVSPQVHDLAAGLVHSARAKDRDWARVLLALNCVDLASLQYHDSGDVLLNAIWDLAEGQEPSSEAIDLAVEFANETG